MGNRSATPTTEEDSTVARASLMPEFGVYAQAVKSLILTNPIKSIVAAVLFTFAITLAYAWIVNPVTYVGANFYDLSVPDQRDVIETMATDVLFDESKPRIVAMARRFPNIAITACGMADEELSRGEVMNGKRVERLWLLVYEITGDKQCQLNP